MEGNKVLPNIPAEESICLDDDDDEPYFDEEGVQDIYTNVIENLEAIAINCENSQVIERDSNLDEATLPIEQNFNNELIDENLEKKKSDDDVKNEDIDASILDVQELSLANSTDSAAENTDEVDTQYQSAFCVSNSTPIPNAHVIIDSYDLTSGESKDSWHTTYDEGFESQLVRGPGGSILEETSKPEHSGLSKYFALDTKVESGDPEARQFFDTLSSQMQDLNADSFMNSFIMKSPEDSQYTSEDAFSGGRGEAFPGNQTSSLEPGINLQNITTSEISPKIQSSEDSPKAISSFFNKETNQNDASSFFDKISQPTSLSSGDATDEPKKVGLIENLSESSQSRSWPVKQEFTKENIPDPFSASLSISEIDRRQDAWIPSEETHKALVAIVTSPPGTYFPEQDKMTMPGLSISDALADPVYEFVYRFLGKQELEKRNIPNMCSVSQDENGLKELIKAGCYRAAVELIGTLLTKWGQGMGRAKHPSKHSQQSLQLWFCRIVLLVKLQQFATAEVELEAFGDLDQPDLYYEYYPDVYQGRRGSLVPFSFRLLYAQLPQHLEKHQEALDRLYKLRTIIKKIIENLDNHLAEDGSMLELSEDDRKASKDLWMKRDIKICYIIGNCLVSMREYSLAVEMFEYLTAQDIQNAANLWSGIGRIYLQVGDLKNCEMSFEKVLNIDDQTLVEAKIRSLTNKALLCIAHNSYQEAHDNYKAALELDPDNPVIINNIAVCLLYMCKLHDALDLLEKSIYNSPDKFLHDGVVFNLCTLYDLGSSQSHQKKLTLLGLANQHSGDGFNIFCLKIKEKLT